MADKKIKKAGAVKHPKKEISAEVISAEVLDKMPEPIRKSVSETMIRMSSGPMANPLASKMTAKHITKIIDTKAQETKADQEYRSTNRRFVLSYVILGIIVFFVMTYFFLVAVPNSELYITILTHLGTAVAGIVGGWGYSKIKG